MSEPSVDFILELPFGNKLLVRKDKNISVVIGLKIYALRSAEITMCSDELTMHYENTKYRIKLITREDEVITYEIPYSDDLLKMYLCNKKEP